MIFLVRIWRFLLVAVAATLVGAASNAAAEDAARPITFEMTVMRISGERGPEPQFNFRIVNVSRAPVRVLDIVKRPDFHDAFLSINISCRGPGGELARDISDPDLSLENAFTELAPGQSLEFALPLSRTVYGRLPPGEYWAHGVYRPDPMEEHGLGTYISEIVEFRISE